MIGLTPENLLVHLRISDKAGCLRITKTGNGGNSRTDVALNGEGRITVRPVARAGGHARSKASLLGPGPTDSSADLRGDPPRLSGRRAASAAATHGYTSHNHHGQRITEAN